MNEMNLPAAEDDVADGRWVATSLLVAVLLMCADLAFGGMEWWPL